MGERPLRMGEPRRRERYVEDTVPTQETTSARAAARGRAPRTGDGSPAPPLAPSHGCKQETTSA